MDDDTYKGDFVSYLKNMIKKTLPNKQNDFAILYKYKRTSLIKGYLNILLTVISVSKF